MGASALGCAPCSLWWSPSKGALQLLHPCHSKAHTREQWFGIRNLNSWLGESLLRVRAPAVTPRPAALVFRRKGMVWKSCSSAQLLGGAAASTDVPSFWRRTDWHLGDLHEALVWHLSKSLSAWFWLLTVGSLGWDRNKSCPFTPGDECFLLATDHMNICMKTDASVVFGCQGLDRD